MSVAPLLHCGQSSLQSAMHVAAIALLYSLAIAIFRHKEQVAVCADTIVLGSATPLWFIYVFLTTSLVRGPLLQ